MDSHLVVHTLPPTDFIPEDRPPFIWPVIPVTCGPLGAAQNTQTPDSGLIQANNGQSTFYTLKYCSHFYLGILS